MKNQNNHKDFVNAMRTLNTSPEGKAIARKINELQTSINDVEDGALRLLLDTVLCPGDVIRKLEALDFALREEAVNQINKISSLRKALHDAEKKLAELNYEQHQVRAMKDDVRKNVKVREASIKENLAKIQAERY